MESRKEQCRRLRGEGKSIRLISKEIGLSPTAVRYHVKDMVVKITQKVGFNRESNLEPILPSADFAYLMGIYLGDGCYSCSKFALTCGTKLHPLLLDKWESVFAKVLGVKPRRNTRKGCVDLYIYDKFLGPRLNIKSGNKTYTCRVPDWIFSDREYVVKCLLGLMESDGGVYHIFHKGYWFWQACFTSVSSGLREDVIRLSDILGLKGKGKGKKVQFGSEDTKIMMEIIGLNKTIEYVYSSKKSKGRWGEAAE